MFLADLENGKKVEVLVKDLFIKRGYDFTLNESNDYTVLKRFDGTLTINDKKYKVEIKNDKMGYTGNFAVEFECSSKPSGISTTEAVFYMYAMLDKLYIFRTEDLKSAIINNEYFRIVSGGDFNRAKMYLFRQSQIFPLAINIIDFKI